MLLSFRRARGVRVARQWADGAKRAWRWRRVAAPAVIGVVLAGCAFAALTSDAAGDAETIRVRVIDGDTIQNVMNGERIRVLNIDTPEAGDLAQCEAERLAAARATRIARELLGGARVTLHRTGADRYGRTLAYVGIDGRDFGRAMVHAGAARPWTGERQPWCAANGALIAPTAVFR